MNRIVKTVTIAAFISGAIFSGAMAQDRAQLIASAGLSQSEAASMSLNDIYVAKINREGRRDERQF